MNSWQILIAMVALFAAVAVLPVRGYRQIACEHQGDKTVSCPDGKYIKVLSAFYGRTDAKTCGHNPNTNCLAQSSPGIIKRNCQGKQSCVLKPQNGIFGDPCGGVVKYIELVYVCTAVPLPYEVVTCENNDINIDCPAGKYIKIVSAYYGRRDAHTCGYNSNTNCWAGSSPGIITRNCDGRSWCRLSPRNSVFGDPCGGVGKYIEVKYECKSEPPSYQVVACEHRPDVTVRCPAGEFIDVVEAYYGRTNAYTCGNNGNTNCKSASSTAKLRENCQGKNYCTLSPKNSIFGDPCGGVVKYIDFKYRCRDTLSGLSEITACEHKPDRTLSCAPGKYINIISAYYGRTDSYVCGYNSNNNCYANNSPGIIRNNCQGKQSCVLSPKNSIFGDPCGEVVKYINVKYECTSQVIKSLVACEHAGEKEASCPHGQVIEVHRAYYGRRNSRVCGHNPENTCQASGSDQKINDLCHHYPSCSVNPHNSVFGDPCGGVVKYIDLDYYCVPSPVPVGAYREIACEHQGDITVSCPDGKYIKVLSAFYGRTDAKTCGHNPNTNCLAQSSPGIIKRNCQGKQSCVLKPQNGIFGDPCGGVVKYIELVYECTAVPLPYEVVTCENNDINIDCPAGKYIKIVSAYYGRKDAHTCGYNSNTNCWAGSSPGIITRNCEGRSWCRLSPRNSVFGDPCGGVRKYIEVKYECKSEPPPYQVVACEHSPDVTVRCPAGEFIDVVEAYYGRTNAYTCGNNGNTNCTAASSTAKLRANCHGKNFCVLSPKNSIFGDPCGGVGKYIDFKYRCRDTLSGLSEITACEHKPDRTLSCAPGKYINIISAYYGRTDSYVCGYNPNNNCYANNSPGIIRNNCQGKQSCVLSAKNSIFGDPCGGVVKYINVKYECTSQVIKSLVACEHAGEKEASCPNGQVIEVHRAYYGRRNSRVCGNNPENTCQASGSYHKINDLCHHYPSCSVNPHNSVFGDPCGGVVKYIDLDYYCVASPYNPNTVTICESNSLKVECPAGKQIYLVEGFYGRDEKYSCNKGPTINSDCKAATSYDKLQDSCDGKTWCSLTASNENYGDPCPGTVKFIKIKFSCI